MRWSPPSLLLCVFGGCNSVECDLSLVSAVTVTVTGPGAALVDRITAENDREEACEQTGDEFVCWEQGGGRYVIRAYQGEVVVATQVARVKADECHVTNGARVELAIPESMP